METATEDVSVGISAGLGGVVIVSFEFDAAVGAFLGRGEVIYSTNLIVDDLREVLIHGLKVGMLLGVVSLPFFLVWISRKRISPELDTLPDVQRLHQYLRPCESAATGTLLKVPLSLLSRK